MFTISQVPFEDDRAEAVERFPAILEVFDAPVRVEDMERTTTAVTEGRVGRGVRIDGVLPDLREWSYAGPTYGEGRIQMDSFCNECGPLTFGEDEAVVWAEGLWAELGMELGVDLELVDVFASQDSLDRDNAVVVLANEVINGVVSPLEWMIVFGGPDGLVHHATGRWGMEVVERGEVPLLTPEEALGTRALGESTDTDTVRLSSRVFLDRSTAVWWLVPTYQVQVSPEFEGWVHLDAVRYQDLPVINEEQPEGG